MLFGYIICHLGKQYCQQNANVNPTKIWDTIIFIFGANGIGIIIPGSIILSVSSIARIYLKMIKWYECCLYLEDKYKKKFLIEISHKGTNTLRRVKMSRKECFDYLQVLMHSNKCEDFESCAFAILQL